MFLYKSDCYAYFFDFVIYIVLIVLEIARCMPVNNFTLKVRHFLV